MLIARYGRRGYHALSWLLITLALAYIGFRTGERLTDLDFWRRLLTIMAVFVSVTYMAFYLRARLLDRRAYLLFGLVSLLLVLAGAYFLSVLGAGFGGDYSFGQSVQNVTVVFVIALGTQYFKRGIVGQYQLQELRAKNMEAELNALKAQLNPHFLFNTLNNIFGVNQLDANKGSEMIMELSEVMRYHLQSSKRDSVSLSEEVQLIQAYIALEALRLNANCRLTVELPDNPPGRLAPLLLLPFIENAFKHGTHPVRPCFITVRLGINEGVLRLFVENSVVRDRKTIGTHTGLANTRRRLMVRYPDRHELSTGADRETYRITLDITL
jgi:hypothetical protein